MRWIVLGLSAWAAAMPSTSAAHATARSCGIVEETGPACLLARKQLSALPVAGVFWQLDRFASKPAAAATTSVVVESFGSMWLFTFARKGWRSSGGEHVSTIGPLPIARASAYTAEYLRSIFNPGTTAPLHVHSGPEAFFAVSGDTCLETPDGARVGREPNNSLVIRAGPLMLLMAIGSTPRRGFALILHDAGHPPTTLVQEWQPKGLCARELPAGHELKRGGN